MTIRLHFYDGPFPLQMRTADTAVRHHVGTLHGQQWFAERDGDDLHIYMVSDDVMPSVRVQGPDGQMTQDRRVPFGLVGATPAEINARNAEIFRRRA